MKKPAFSAISAALPLLVLLAAVPACKTGIMDDVPGEFTYRGTAVHPAAVSALYRSADGQLDLAAFKTKFEARQWEDQYGWWVTDLEEDPVSGRSPFFAYAAFAGPLSGGAELYVLSIAFNAGEPADVNNILLIRKSGAWLGLIRSWEEGSACDGGILTPRMDDDNFLYSRELTPGGLLELAAGRPARAQCPRGPRGDERELFRRRELRLQPDPGPRGPRLGPPLRRAGRRRKGPDGEISLPVLLQPDLQRVPRAR